MKMTEYRNKLWNASQQNKAGGRLLKTGRVAGLSISSSSAGMYIALSTTYRFCPCPLLISVTVT